MENETYKLKNIQLASFLAASHLEFVRAKKEEGVVFFEFSPKDKAEKLLSHYFSGKAKVDPRELFARLNDLRDLIFSGGKE